MAAGSFVGSAAFSNVAGQVRYTSDTGLVTGDVDGNATVDWILQLADHLTLTAADFIF